jgi:hypothetical protein
LLSRIPAVKWAVNRLRPLPHSGSIGVAQIAADEQPTAITTEEAAPTIDIVGAEPLHREVDVEVVAPVAEDTAAISVTAESLSAEPTDTIANDDSSVEARAKVEPIVDEEVSASPIEVASEPVDAPEVISSDPLAELLTYVEPAVVNGTPASSCESEAVDAPEPVVSSDLPAELLADAEPEIVEEAPVSSVEIEEVDAPEPVVSSDAAPELAEDVPPDVAEQIIVAAAETETTTIEAAKPVVDDEPVFAASMEPEPAAIDETPVIVLEVEVSPAVVVEASVDSEPAPGVAAEIELDLVDDLPSVAAEVAEETTIHAPVAAAQVEPDAVSVSPSPAAPKARPKVVEPTDRAALIRQRWTETGIRMWNPRLHGTGEATLNIQGRIGLLPPEPGETMPRYDKLEFKLLGGQIVCEGVIVEAPVHAGQRSFTRLAEPRSADRTREPVRERQAALA